MSKEEQTSDDVHIAPEREDRFRWNSTDDVVWLDKKEEPGEGEEGDESFALALEDDESVAPWQMLEADDEAAPICQGPFWPSPDDPDTGYCTCCEQVYQGDLQDHPCMNADDQDGEIEDDGDEDTAKRPAIRP